MFFLGRIFVSLFAPLVKFTEILGPRLAAIANRSPVHGDFALAAIVISAGLIAFLCSFWAACEHVRNMHITQHARHETVRAQSAQRFRDALIAAGGQPIVVLGSDLSSPLSFAGGQDLLQSCLAGPDAVNIATSLDFLFRNGTAFECVALTSERRTVTVKGKTVGGRVVVFFRNERKISTFDLDGRGVLDALSVPVWVRSKDLALRWVNRAFLEATGAPSFQNALESDMAFDPGELQLAASVLDEGVPVEAKRYAHVAGERRALALKLQPLSDVGVAGTAIDVTEATQKEIGLQTHIDGLKNILDDFETAVAAYDGSQHLVAFNRAFADLWDLPAKWLRAEPTYSNVLDRLREDRHLPEQRDFAAWKRDQVDLFHNIESVHDALWHLPSGKSLRMRVNKNTFGGLTFRFKDMSEQLRLESAYNAALQVQKSTLDSLDDAVAIIGPDGRIAASNTAFARLWQLSDSELSSRPHIRQVAEFCAARTGCDHLWDVVASGVVSSEPERLKEWGRADRADGRSITLAMKRLPDGSTLATFFDLADTAQFESELHRRDNEAA